MTRKAPPEVLSPSDLAYMSTLNERDRRWFLSTNAAQRAAMTTTKKGLKVIVHVNSKSYDIMRPIDESYQKRLEQQVIFAPELGKWNYLVKTAN